MNPYFFYIFASVTVFFVVLMIFQKNPISSALCLIASFFGLAGLYVMLDAHFIAVLQILVYAGAIMVLFIFVIMLLNLKKEDLRVSRLALTQVLAVLLGLGFMGFLVFKFIELPTAVFPEALEGFGNAETLGRLLFSKYVVPFEVIGVLLLVGVVGAVLLGRRES